jgi:coenzyme F420 hydrogenase subunit beta
MPITSVHDVAAAQLCCGCGVCASAEPAAIAMVDDARGGRRPVPTGAAPTGLALAVCPGLGLERAPTPAGADTDLAAEWGPVLGIWEGHAGDPEIRWAGSSGGAATALALHCIDDEGFAGAVHTAARAGQPLLNETVFSRSRADLLARTGSRYAPASPGDRLDLVERAGGPCVFVGKPCDVAGVHRLRAARPRQLENLGLTIAVFCAGTPTIAGTLEMLEVLGIAADAVHDVRFRGQGWPGRATVRFSDEGGAQDRRSLSYEEAWGGILQRHRQWRCHLCVDHTGEFADVAVGDPWYRPVADGEAGSSLIVARTERGRHIVERAIAAGALVAEPVDRALLPASQPNLLLTHGSVWGRTATLRLLGLPAPRYRGFAHRRIWLRRLGPVAKAKSVTGTLRRVRRRRLAVRATVVPAAAGDAAPPVPTTTAGG